MKVLLSAFACDPTMGSEPGVGWNWAVEISRLGHEVWVITDSYHREAVEAAMASPGAPGNLHFLYHQAELFGIGLEFHKIVDRGDIIYFYYVIWQWGAFKIVRKLLAHENFDLIHHITYGGIRVPSFMGKLGIPFWLGPLGGGERVPYRLRYGFSFKEWMRDALRDIHNMFIRFDPLMRQTYGKASLILTKTGQSRAAVPAAFRNKVRISIEIGCSPADVASPQQLRLQRTAETGLQLLFVGQFVNWKGVHLVIEAFAEFIKRGERGRLTMVGKGPSGKQIMHRAQQLGVADLIEWPGWLLRSELPAVYLSHDVMVYPSLHDSSGNVVIEALAKGLPVVCLDLGGPAELVDDRSGIKISTTGRDTQSIVSALSDSLVDLAKNPQRRSALALGAVDRAQQLTWSRIIGQLYGGLPAPKC